MGFEGNNTLLAEAEKAIHIIDERFQYAARATNDAVYDLDLIAKRIFWSETYETIFGYSLSETECDPDTWLKHIHPQDREQVKVSLEKALAENRPFWRNEYRYVCATGIVLYVVDQAYIFYDAEKTPLRMIGAMKNVTENKQNDMVIRRQTAYLQQLFDASPLGIVMLDDHDRIVKVNKGFEEMFQHKNFEVQGFYINDIIVPEQMQEEGRHISSTCLSKKQIQRDSVRKRKDGTLIDVQIVGYPIVVNDELAGIYGIYVDISHRKRSEEKLKKSEQQYRTLIDTMNEGLLQVDNDDRIQFVNHRYCEMIGYTEQELLGQISYKMVFEQEEDQKKIQHKNEQRKAGRSDRYEVKMKRKDGEEIWVLISAAPIKDADGNVIGSLGAMTDITEQKNNELVLQSKNKELQKTNAELDRFVYSASHELRAPLTSIMGLINLVQMEATGEQNEYLDMMRKSIGRLDHFIQDIIHFSHNSRTELRSEKIDFGQLVQEVIDDLRFIEGADSIQGIYNIQSAIHFYSDKKRISTLLNNLISNAIKYHNLSQENPYIDISVNTCTKFAEIKVEDNGTGIPEDYLGKIYEMFFRASESSQGSGLGLYIVKEIVDALHGEISVESQLGKGTVFTIKLPNFN